MSMVVDGFCLCGWCSFGRCLVAGISWGLFRAMTSASQAEPRPFGLVGWLPEFPYPLKCLEARHTNPLSLRFFVRFFPMKNAVFSWLGLPIDGSYNPHVTMLGPGKLDRAGGGRQNAPAAQIFLSDMEV